MIEDRDITFEGKVFTWSHDPDVESPPHSWTWMDANTYMTPAEGLAERLTRAFIDHCAADVVADLEETENVRFCQILEAMGATDDEIRTFGLNDALIALHPEKTPSRFVTNMPPAAHGPLNSVEVHDWFFGSNNDDSDPPTTVGCLGYGPFQTDNFSALLKRKGIACCNLNETTEVLVLGRKGWANDEIDQLIDMRVGKFLRIYSQEMFLAFLGTRSDPFRASCDVLEAFKAGHAGLEFVSEGWQGWVTLYVSPARRTTPSQRINSNEYPPESPLSVLGYHVGQKGEVTTTRRRILRQAFTGQLPLVASAEYMAQWDEPDTPGRLKKIADNIATYCRHNKSRIALKQAVEDWESDLAWMHDKFYHGRFRFQWPNTFV